jgi:hypothetical protein
MKDFFNKDFSVGDKILYPRVLSGGNLQFFVREVIEVGIGYIRAKPVRDRRINPNKGSDVEKAGKIVRGDKCVILSQFNEVD